MPEVCESSHSMYDVDKYTGHIKRNIMSWCSSFLVQFSTSVLQIQYILMQYWIDIKIYNIEKPSHTVVGR